MRALLLVVVFFSVLPAVVRFPFIGILMWFWVSLMNPQQVMWGASYAQLPYALIVAIVTLAAWVLSREPKLPPGDRTTALLVLLMLWTSVTSLFAIAPASEVYYYWQLAEKMLLFTLLAYVLTYTRQRLELLIAACVLSLAVFGFRGGLFVLLTGGNYRVWGPAATMIGDNNQLGVALTMILPLLCYMWQRYRQPYLRWPLLALIGLTFLADVFTYSRGALLSLGVMGAMLWFRSRQKLVLMVLIVAAAAGVWSFAPPQWFDRMATIQSYQEDASAESRLYYWKLATAMAVSRPLVGGGYRWSFYPAIVNARLADSGLPPLGSPRATHSIWFDMLGEHGFVGLAIFVAIVVSALVDARWLVRQSRRNPELLWANNLGRMLQVALIGFIAGGTFVSMSMYDGFYALVVITAAARRVVARELLRQGAAVVGTRRTTLPRSLRPRPAQWAGGPR